jgi:broad specificity phosphatase PhoE
MDTLIVFRHGESELNLRCHLTGEEAERASQEKLPPDVDAIADLTEEGEAHARALRQILAYTAIDACFSSPALRAQRTAEIVLGERVPAVPIEVKNGLIERHRGVFYFMPDETAAKLKLAHPEYVENPHSTLQRRHKHGETLLEVMDRLLPIVTYADQMVPHGTVAFSAHGDIMTALRALIGRLNDEQLAAPLIPNPPAGFPPLQRANWNSYCQTDIYTKRHPFDGTIAPHMTHFQSMGMVPEFFQTGWLELPTP